MTTIEATLVTTKVESKEKTQRLFKLSSPVSLNNWDFDEEDDLPSTTQFILVSRIIAFDHGGWETLIFPADKNGEVINWQQLWEVRGWEHIGTTLDNFLEVKNAERLQTSSSLLD